MGSSRFTPGIDSRYGLNRRLGVPQSRSGRFEGEKNPLSLLGFETRTVLPTLKTVIHTNAESVTWNSQQAPKKQSHVTTRHYPLATYHDGVIPASVVPTAVGFVLTDERNKNVNGLRR